MKKSLAIKPKNKLIKAKIQLGQKSTGPTSACLKNRNLIKIPHTNVRKGSCWIGSPHPVNGVSDALDEEYVANCMNTHKPDSKGIYPIGCRSM